MSTLVVMSCQGLESFLSSCVPQDDLYLIRPMLQYDFSSTEFHRNRASQCFGRHRVLHVSVAQGSLTDTRLANKHYLDHLTELFNWLARCSRRDRHMMRLSATCTAIVLLMLGKCMWLCLNTAHVPCGHAIAIKTSHMGSLVLELG